MNEQRNSYTGHTSADRPAHRRNRRVSAVVLAGATALVAGLGLTLAGLSPAYAAVSAASTGAASASPHVVCSAVPSLCGFPDATNTGVPASATLRTVPTQVSSGPGWFFDSRGWLEVNGNGAVLSNLYIPYTLDIQASNVTIKNVHVVTSGQSSFGISVRHTSNVTIENSTINGLNAGPGRLMVGIKDIYSDSTGLRILNNSISLVGTGVQTEAGLIQDNYIFDCGYIYGDHIDGIHSDGGGSALLNIQHNTVFVPQSQTGAVVLNEDAGVQSNRIVNNNLLSGGGYAIYAGQSTGGPVANKITISNNVISTATFTNGGFYGPATGFNRTGPGNTWTSNTWDSTGATIAAPTS
jgi:hypothetical protein